MVLEPGDPALSGDISESRPGTEAVAAGDAVAFGSGEMSPATDSDDFAGIARHDGVDNAGHGNSAILKGVVVANVATGVAEGETLQPSGTAGELAVATDIDENALPGPVLALSDEGGSWHGEEQTYDVPDGYAVVYVSRSHA